MKLSTTLPTMPLATRVDKNATTMLSLFSPAQLPIWRYDTPMYIAAPFSQSLSNKFSKLQ